jgi:H+-translocating NAD(P) transhydrogenase subunit beta
VGSAGLILTRQMCEAMNRSLREVLMGGFGDTGHGDGAGGGDVRRTTAGDVAIALGYADSVLVVPGYGLAVAQAQHALHRLVGELEGRGVRVAYAVHPVAGRMPGHMNVLLAEAEVPYDQLLDLEQANATVSHTEVVLVVGANDVVNISARDDPESPIFGMPVLEVDRAGTVVVVKRSLAPGFAGIDNPLFYADGTQMLLADARDAIDAVTSAMSSV